MAKRGDRNGGREVRAAPSKVPTRTKGRQNQAVADKNLSASPKHYRHGSVSRKNLATPETDGIVPEDQKTPTDFTPQLNDPGRNPRLSWQRTLSSGQSTTLAYPLYIHEKIHPGSLVQDLLENNDRSQLGFWSDFNNLPANAAFEWYRHEGNWQNRIIRGNSVDIMASLAAKENLSGTVQMVYYDPPYNVGLGSNMQVSSDKPARHSDDRMVDLPNDPLAVSTYRDMYKNGIHSYLDILWENCVYAREMLAESGSLFLQMGSDNVHHVAIVISEVFGPENHVATIPFRKSGNRSSKTLPVVCDYLLWYAKNIDLVKYHPLHNVVKGRKERIASIGSGATVDAEKGPRGLTSAERIDPQANLQGCKVYKKMPIFSAHHDDKNSRPYTWRGKRYYCPPGKQWVVRNPEGLDKLDAMGRLGASKKSQLFWKRYEDETPGPVVTNMWEKAKKPTDMHYIVETAEPVVERCMLMSTDPGDLVLDITCGSGTTAYVAEKQGRRWITTDTSGVAISLARQRLAAAVFDYYKLRDEKRDAGPDSASEADPARNFVYETSNVVSAKSLVGEEVMSVDLRQLPEKIPGLKRVSSPFTVESVSPYRFLAASDVVGNGSSPMQQRRQETLHECIISALSMSGVRLLKNRQRLEVYDIAPPTGFGEIENVSYVAESGAPGQEHGKTAIAIVRDDRTVSTQLVRQLALDVSKCLPEVVRTLIIGFAFEPGTRNKDMERYGKMEIVCAQAHHDLQIPGLKDQSKHDAFVQIGQPDVDIRHVQSRADEKKQYYVVEIKGYDTFNPGKGNIDRGDVMNIDCWMLDSNYNGEAFYARSIHFPNKTKDKQLCKLKTELGSLIVPEKWESMLSTTSAPFPSPQTGKIAVKIVTTTFTEMTSVFSCPGDDVSSGGRKRR